LEFKNGEVLRGTLMPSNDGLWHFRSENLGEITVPIERATVREMPVAAAVEPAPSVSPAPAGAPVARPAAAPPVTVVTTPWKRSLEAGYALQSSRVNKSDAYLRAELFRVNDRYSYRFFGKYLYGQQGGVRSVDKFEGGLLIRHNFADRLLLRQDFTYQNDRLRLLDADALALSGVSYRFVRAKTLTLSAGPGVGVRYREVELARRGFTLNGDFTTEAVWTPAPRIRVTQTTALLAEYGRINEYRLVANSVASGLLTDAVSINLRYEYEFDHGRPVTAGRIDQRVFTTLGYTF
jgi:putative salt-induced outer membrane protein YdiY